MEPERKVVKLKDPTGLFRSKIENKPKKSKTNPPKNNVQEKEILEKKRIADEKIKNINMNMKNIINQLLPEQKEKFMDIFIKRGEIPLIDKLCNNGHYDYNLCLQKAMDINNDLLVYYFLKKGAKIQPVLKKYVPSENKKMLKVCKNYVINELKFSSVDVTLKYELVNDTYTRMFSTIELMFDFAFSGLLLQFGRDVRWVDNKDQSKVLIQFHNGCEKQSYDKVEDFCGCCGRYKISSSHSCLYCSATNNTDIKHISCTPRPVKEEPTITTI
jgi:hypothetical protein